jgi:hypothetical protein
MSDAGAGWSTYAYSVPELLSGGRDSRQSIVHYVHLSLIGLLALITVVSATAAPLVAPVLAALGGIWAYLSMRKTGKRIYGWLLGLFVVALVGSACIDFFLINASNELG